MRDPTVVDSKGHPAMSDDVVQVALNHRELALRALVTKCVAETARAATANLREELAAALGAGDRVTVRSPDGDGDVGMVYRTNPKGTARVTDEHLFTAWMKEKYPDRVQFVSKLDEVDISEVIQVLTRHAPYLIRQVPLVRPWATNEVLELTKRACKSCGPGGEPDVPGVSWEPPGDGVVTVRLSDDGPDVIKRLWRTGRVDVESGEVRGTPEISGGRDD